jgi:hypothetical protein
VITGSKGHKLNSNYRAAVGIMLGGVTCTAVGKKLKRYYLLFKDPSLSLSILELFKLKRIFERINDGLKTSGMCPSK